MSQQQPDVPGTAPASAPSGPIIRYQREAVRRRKRLAIPRRDPAALDPEAAYTRPTVAAFFGVSQQTIRRWEWDGRRPRPIAGFPAGVKLGAKTYWRGHLLIDWLRRLLDDEREELEAEAQAEATRSPRSRAMGERARKRWAQHSEQRRQRDLSGKGASVGEGPAPGALTTPGPAPRDEDGGGIDAEDARVPEPCSGTGPAAPGVEAPDQPHATAAEPRGPARFIADATYSLEQVAAALGVSRRTLWRWRGQGRLKFPRPFKMGRQPHWRGWALNNWMDTRQREALS